MRVDCLIQPYPYAFRTTRVPRTSFTTMRYLLAGYYGGLMDAYCSHTCSNIRTANAAAVHGFPYSTAAVVSEKLEPGAFQLTLRRGKPEPLLVESVHVAAICSRMHTHMPLRLPTQHRRFCVWESGIRRPAEHIAIDASCRCHEARVVQIIDPSLFRLDQRSRRVSVQSSPWRDMIRGGRQLGLSFTKLWPGLDSLSPQSRDGCGATNNSVTERDVARFVCEKGGDAGG